MGWTGNARSYFYITNYYATTTLLLPTTPHYPTHMTSTDFSWRKPDAHTRYTPKTLSRKRRLSDDEPVRPPADKPLARRIKRSRTPRILGQNLPVSRIVELMDHASLQRLLQEVVTHHPEVGHTVQLLAPKPTVKEAMQLVQRKLDDMVAHLPYKCDVESDYSYARVKPYLTELLNCISDFILTLLPPMEASLASACQMLDLITDTIHALPDFSNSEFQYTRQTAYEQLANLWLIVLAHHQDEDHELCDDAPKVESSIELMKVVAELDLVAKVQRHNDKAHGKFAPVAEFLRAELDVYDHIHAHNAPGSIFNDLITVDYSNYSIAARTSH